jgi:hypothetical protein
MKTLIQSLAAFGLLIASAVAVEVAQAASNELPKTTTDGLVLQPDTKLRAVYLKPGASLAGYDKVALVDCFVSFKKNWQREYNEDASFEMRVSNEDMKKIKERVANEFKAVFTKELEAGGYQIVDNAADDVLVVRPAIINLVVTAPDTMSPGMEQSFAPSAGEMTLYVELYDSVSNDIIARIIDPEADKGPGVVANRVTNKAAADRLLKMWADTLRDHLGAVKAATTGS